MEEGLRGGIMEYQEMLRHIFDERKKIDRAVEDIVRLNGRGKLLHIDKPAVSVRKSGSTYKLANNSSGIFITET
jgi:hypothetical protein